MANDECINRLSSAIEVIERNTEVAMETAGKRQIWKKKKKKNGWQSVCFVKPKHRRAT